MNDRLSSVLLARPDTVGPGIRVAVKDLFDTAGLVTTYGSIIFADHIPASSAQAVLRLEAAGYANVGKANLHEFAYGVTSENPHFGTVPNPIAPGRIAGGSSGGSAAAVVAGLADVGLGSDSGGSIRIPAACCGLVGFKPTYGLTPSEGCFPLAPSFDHVGPIAASVEDCVALVGALAPGFRAQELDSLDQLRVRVGWLETADPLVAARVRLAANRFVNQRELELELPEDAVSLAFKWEVGQVHRDLFAEHADLYGPDVRIKVGRCLELTDGDLRAGERARARYVERALEEMEATDLLITPTMPCVAPRTPTGDVGDLAVRGILTRFTFPFNAVGWPAIALPCGPADDGLPASVQLVGRPGDDALVLAAGRLLEQALAAAPGQCCAPPYRHEDTFF